jgi:hypothetical protein
MTITIHPEADSEGRPAVTVSNGVVRFGAYIDGVTFQSPIPMIEEAARRQFGDHYAIDYAPATRSILNIPSHQGEPHETRS